MAGLNHGYKYTATRTARLPASGISKTHPIDVYDAKTRVLLFSCPTVLDVVEKTGVSESTVYYQYKKNKNKYQDEWVSHNGLIFISAKKPIF